jgi:hypothetical protein
VAGSGGFVIPFSSAGVVAGFQFQSTSPAAVTTVVATAGVESKFVCPVACKVSGITASWATGHATAVVQISKDGGAAFSDSGAVFATPGKVAITNGVGQAIAAGSFIEVKTVTANLGKMTVNVSFA